MAKNLPRSPDAFVTYRIIYPCVELRLMNESNQNFITEWKKVFDSTAYSFNQGEKMEEIFLHKCRLKNIQVVTVESCTGGMIAKLLSDIPGASDVLLGSLVTYTNEFKKVAGVNSEILIKHGAVSHETALEMIKAGMNFLPNKNQESLLVIAVTGFASPTSPEDSTNVGTVHIAVSLGNKNTISKKLQFGKRTRDQIRVLSCAASFQMAFSLLK